MYDTLYDTIIYGEGLSAVSAAMTLSRQGCKVLAVSPSGYLGSEISVSLLPALKKGICGTADLLIDDLEKANAWHQGYVDSVACQVRILKLLKNVDILFYQRPAGIVADATVMQGIILAGKNGLATIR